MTKKVVRKHSRATIRAARFLAIALLSLGIPHSTPAASASSFSLFSGISSDDSDDSPTNDEGSAPAIVSPSGKDLDEVRARRLDDTGPNEGDDLLYNSKANWRWLATPPVVMPGAEVTNLTKDRTCTVGWIVAHEAVKYALVAGHCGQPGDTFAIKTPEGATKEIGDITTSEFINGYKDWAVIRLNDGTKYRAKLPRRGMILGDVSAPAVRSFFEMKANKTQVCFLGAASGMSCGPYLFTDSEGMIHFYAKVSPGDSGAPVFIHSGDRVYPIGVLSAAQQPGLSDVSAQPLKAIFDKWPLEMATN